MITRRKKFETKEELKIRRMGNIKNVVKKNIKDMTEMTNAGVNPSDRANLTPHELKFVLEYMKDYVAAYAAERSGYSAQMGYLLLKKPKVLAAIDSYEKNLATRFIFSKNKVLKELSLISNSDISDYVEIIDGKTYLKDTKDLLPQISRAIKKVRGTRKVTAIKDSKGNYTGEDILDDKIEIELYDKIQALQLMGKELNMFKDKTEITGANGSPLLPVKLVLDFGAETAIASGE